MDPKSRKGRLTLGLFKLNYRFQCIHSWRPLGVRLAGREQTAHRMVFA